MTEMLSTCGLTEQQADIQGETVFDRKSKQDECLEILYDSLAQVGKIFDEMHRLKAVQDGLDVVEQWDLLQLVYSVDFNVYGHIDNIMKNNEKIADLSVYLREPNGVEEFCGESQRKKPDKDEDFWQSVKEFEKIARVEGWLYGALCGGLIGLVIGTLVKLI